jgi:hypothetical protein
MKQKTSLSAACGVLALAIAGIAGAANAETVPQASIAFANHGGIRDWEADRDRGLWVQDAHRRWYYAKLMGRCIGLNFAQSIGFDTHPLGRFDRFSAIVVPGSGKCQVQSFTPSGAPKADRAADRADQPS